MNEYLQYILDDFFYTIVDTIVLAVSLGIFIKLIALTTPLKSWDKIKDNSVALSIVWMIILFIFGAFIVAGFFLPS